MDQEKKTAAPEEELMTEETAEAAAEEKAPEDKKAKKKKSKEAEALERCEAEKKELEDRYLRLMAEYDNYRRRTQKERDNIYPDAVADTLKELLPLLDNLQRALETPCADESYITGIRMIQTGFEEYLKRMGVEAFGRPATPSTPTCTMPSCTSRMKAWRKTWWRRYSKAATAAETASCGTPWCSRPTESVSNFNSHK